MPADKAQNARRAGEFGSSPARVASAVGAIVGLALMLAGLIGGTGWGWHWGWAWLRYLPVVALGVGALAVAFFVFLNIGWLGQVITGRAAASGLLVAVMCAAAVVLWAAGGYFFVLKGEFTFRGKAHKLSQSWDLTKGKLFTLGDQTRAQLRELKEPLKVTVVSAGREYEAPQVTDLLDLYARGNRQVQVDYLRESDRDFNDRNQKLKDEIKAGDRKLGDSLVLRYGGKHKILTSRDLWDVNYGGMGMEPERTFKGEEALTSAIFELLDPKKPKVYFVWGHDERDTGSRGGDGLSEAAQLLETNNIEYARLSLLTAEKIPEDASLLVICGPRRAIPERELGLLQSYLEERKGRLLICLGAYRPEAEVGLEPLLQQGLGVAAGRNVFIEPRREYHHPEYRSITAAEDFGEHAIVAPLRRKAMIFFGRARALARAEEPGGGGRAVDPLVSGSEESYGETDLEALARGETRYQEDKDGPRPASYAVACGPGQPPAPGMKMPEAPRAVVVGDAEWCTNQLMAMSPGNKSFFMNSVNWLLDRGKRITIQPKKAEESGLSLTYSRKVLAHVVAWSALLVLLAVAGVVAWVRRR